MKELLKKEYIETNFSKKGEVEDYSFQSFDVYTQYGITDPIEGFKKIYDKIGYNGIKPVFVWLGCGAQYLCIVQATDQYYASCIIFGYSTTNILFLKMRNKVWYTN